MIWKPNLLKLRDVVCWAVELIYSDRGREVWFCTFKFHCRWDGVSKFEPSAFTCGQHFTELNFKLRLTVVRLQQGSAVQHVRPWSENPVMLPSLRCSVACNETYTGAERSVRVSAFCWWSPIFCPFIKAFWNSELILPCWRSWEVGKL